ncbi:MAG: uroporphyrinogen-III C-methyltransferase [Burkholderiales bacterium]|jgi:uroporphyrin-3 C-methyltransferase|nr:uroporphyrinogen-III C-methyltransferase [Burkholderiales bacterium]
MQDTSEKTHDEDVARVKDAEKVSANDTSAEPFAETPPRRSASGQFGNKGMMALLWLAVLALAAAQFYVWQENKKNDNAWQTDTAQRLTKLESVRQHQENLENQYISGQRLLQERLTALDARINQTQTEQQAIKKLYMQSLPARDEITMREVEYRVRFAEQQLATTGNVQTALSALQEADNELATLDRADLADVRVALTQDIEVLQRAPAFDARDFLVKLDQSLETTETMTPYDLPTTMPATRSSEREEMSGWRYWWQGVKDTILSMVRVQIGQLESRGIVAADVALDRQELRLRLLTLRMMILTRQSATRGEAIALSSWLSDHFDNDDAHVAALQKMLSDLVASPITVSPPDVSKTVDALRVWRATQTHSAESFQ